MTEHLEKMKKIESHWNPNVACDQNLGLFCKYKNKIKNDAS